MVINNVYQFVGSKLRLRYFWKRGKIRKWVLWNRKLKVLYTLCTGVLRKFNLHLHLCFIQKVYTKTDSWFQKSLEEFWQLQTSSGKSKKLKVDGLGTTFMQKLHYIQRIYLTLLSTTCVKIHFSRHNSSVFF